jgi:redox-sensing transcriptional repressor
MLNGASRHRKIPNAVIKRLSLYSRVLQAMEMRSVEKISSMELGDKLGLNPAQIRKDLAYFGQFGVRGVGYYVADLRKSVKRILGTDREVRVGLIGAGNLGSALLSYGGFARQGFKIVVAFDNDRRKVGSIKNNVHIVNVRELEEKIKSHAIDLVILAVPAHAAQEMVERVVKAGVKAILNFVPTRLVVPDNVKVHYVDLAIEIESLTYYLR